ncbi:hypothetical protein [Embleya hyalina]|uniref:DUF317 domain-containing protein n=1 Tax=Embleya hyalina TaxID=516124 RepID=A0A401YN41_9ACTN|nr:hypothetical protein [Embleya hyalina]GCD96030.1 hypothetical protein EHYA_03714 [Embleya hyalina]
MNVWAHDGLLYEVESGYSLPDDAWRYELAGISGAPGTGPYLVVLIPDATPDDGPFTPKRAEHIRTVIHDGRTPWPVLLRFVDLIEGSGDVTHGPGATSNVGTPTSSNDTWQFADRRFAVNSYRTGDRDAWCHELYEVAPRTSGNNSIEVRIPDVRPADGPFVAATADRATFTAHGAWTLPWPVFRHFLDVVEAAGDLVADATTAGRPKPLPTP